MKIIKVLDAILLRGGLILATLSMIKGRCGCFGFNFGWFGAPRGPLGLQMAYLGFQDTDWVSGNDNEVLNVILRRDSLILCTLNMDKVECGYLRCISGRFGAPREPLGSP